MGILNGIQTHKQIACLFRSLKHGTTFEWMKYQFRWFDAFYRQVFLTIFLITNTVFLIYSANYLFGNHDYDAVKHGISLTTWLWYGRYSNALPLLITGGYLSPVINSILSIAAMSASSILICALFQVPKRKKYWIPACLIPMLLPYVVTWFYYSYETFSHTLLPVLAVGAIALVRNKFNLERFILSSGLIWFCLGVYPSVLAFLLLCIGGLFLFDLINRETLRTFCLRYAAVFFVVATSGIVFKGTILVLRASGKMSSTIYSLAMPSSPELVRKFLPELLLSFKQFFHDTPYIPASLKLVLLAIIFTAVILTAIQVVTTKNDLPPEQCSRDTPFKKAIRLFLLFMVWIGMFFATMIPDYLSQVEYPYVVRTAYFGVPFLTLIAATFIFRLGKKPLINIATILIVFILWCSSISDLDIQKNWKIGFQNEILAYSRVLAMMEQNPDVCALKSPVNYLQVGSLPSGRIPFCRPKINDGKSSFELHSFEFNPDWSPRAGIVYDYLGSKFKWNYRGSFRVDSQEISTFFDLKSPRWLAFLENACAYPAPPEQCLFVDPDSNSVVIVLNEEVLEQLKAETRFE